MIPDILRHGPIRIDGVSVLKQTETYHARYEPANGSADCPNWRRSFHGRNSNFSMITSDSCCNGFRLLLYT